MNTNSLAYLNLPGNNEDLILGKDDIIAQFELQHNNRQQYQSFCEDRNYEKVSGTEICPCDYPTPKDDPSLGSASSWTSDNFAQSTIEKIIRTEPVLPYERDLWRRGRGEGEHMELRGFGGVMYTKNVDDKEITLVNNPNTCIGLDDDKKTSGRVDNRCFTDYRPNHDYKPTRKLDDYERGIDSAQTARNFTTVVALLKRAASESEQIPRLPTQTLRILAKQFLNSRKLINIENVKTFLNNKKNNLN